MKETRKCSKCGKEFLKQDLIQYTTFSGKTTYWLCETCYKEKIAREQFSSKVCEIFGLVSPGPRIWNERKRIQDKYGYTDNVIIDTLEYLYYVKKCNKYAESLYQVTPKNVQDMIVWKTNQEELSKTVKAETKLEQKETFIQFNKHEKKVVEKINPDDYL